MTFRKSWTIPSLLFMASCGNGDAETEEDPAEHACEVVGETGTALSASQDIATAPVITPSLTPYTVSVPSMQPAYLKLTAPLEAILFAKTANVVHSLVVAGSDENLLGEPSPSEFCPAQIPEHWELDRELPGELVLQLGPVVVSEVWLSLTSNEGHGHE